jgi:O-antigen ligase
MNQILSFVLAAKLPLSTLIVVGALGALVIIGWGYSYWRAAVKVAFIAVLIEGAIRKWLLPSGEELVYFLKDVFLMGAYLKFYFAPDPELRALKLRVPGTLVVLLCALVSFSALNPNIGSPLLAAYGLKIYFMYVPLTFMMPYLFRTQQEMLRQLTWYVLLAIPICLLGFLQYSSDRFSVLNTFAAGMSESGATGFGVGDRARVTGTFSYLTGHTTFVIVFFALTVALLALRETRWKWLFIFAVIPMLAGNALMGGSRASIVSMAFVTVGFALVAISGRLGTSRNFVMALAVGSLLAMGGAVYLFADALAHWESRAKTAEDSVHSRTIDHPVAALKAAYHDGGAFGFGIGTLHPATVAIRNKLGIPLPKDKPPFLDNELGQVLAELGLMGFLSWYALRLLLLGLVWQSYRSSPPGNMRVLCLAIILIVGPYLLISVVYNHTASFYVFALSGFGLIPLLEPTIQRRVVPRNGAAPRVALPGSTSAPATPPHRGRRT